MELKTVVMPFRWWINTEARICFGFDAVEDADERWLAETIEQKVPAGDCIFYFAYGSKRTEGGCEQILERVGLSGLRVDMRLVTPAR
jgi:hypothetical protein